VFNILLIVPRTYSYTMHAAAGETHSHKLFSHHSQAQGSTQAIILVSGLVAILYLLFLKAV